MELVQLTWFEMPVPEDISVINAIENQLGVSFPEDYREFLLKFQGGYPIQTDFYLNDPHKSMVAVGVFLSTKQERAADYLLYTKSLLSDRLPMLVIPIAIDPGGDYICLDFRRGVKPVVLYWHHERCGYPDEFTFIANIFNEFLSLLYKPDIEEEVLLD